MAQRILPLMGHNARDFARAAAVCRDWKALSRAAAATVGVYREAAFVASSNNAIYRWSSCGKFIAAITMYREHSPFRITLWRVSTGARAKEWDLPLMPDPYHGGATVWMVFSGDGTRLLTFRRGSDHFAIWSVPDGRRLAAHEGRSDGFSYTSMDFGAGGLVGCVGYTQRSLVGARVDLWDVSHQPPRIVNSMDLPDRPGNWSLRLSFSQDGSKLITSSKRLNYGRLDPVNVYDVASLTLLGSCADAIAMWTPDQRVLLMWDSTHNGDPPCLSRLWDFRTESTADANTAVVTADTPAPSSSGMSRWKFHSWSPSGASYFVHRVEGGMQALVVPSTFALEERRTADGSLVRTVTFRELSTRFEGRYPRVVVSPDARALLLLPFKDIFARVIVFD